jgi:hypothetical protein
MASHRSAVAALVLALALGSAFAGMPVADHMQCGGKGGQRCSNNNPACKDAPWADAVCSNSKSKCQRINEWHWQCVPGAESSKPATTSGTVLAAWQQCGGKGAECNKAGACNDSPFANYVCADGYSCQRSVSADGSAVACLTLLLSYMFA